MAIDRPLTAPVGFGRRVRAAVAERPRYVAVTLLGFLAATVLIRLLLVRGHAAPWVMVDELFYSESAKSIAEDGRARVRDGPVPSLGLYPYLIAPAWLAESMATTYTVAKAINVALMSLAAVPVFLWARRLVSPLAALLPAALVLVMPAFVLNGLLMTENAFFPVFVLATFAIAVALERQTFLTQALALAAIGLAVAVRVQALILFVILASAALLFALLELRVGAHEGSRSRAFLRYLSPYWPTAAVIVGLTVAYVGLKAVRGEAIASGLGIYAPVTSGAYEWLGVLRWTMYHAAELGLSVALLPLSALILLSGLVWTRAGESTPAERAFVAVSLSAVVWLTIEVGVFASTWAFRIEERNLFHVAPLLLIGLVVWLQRGVARPPVLGGVAALLPVALLIVLPFESLLNVSILSDTVSLIPLLELTEHEGSDVVRLAIFGSTLFVALVFLTLPKRVLTVAAPTLVAAFFFGWSFLVYQRLEAHSVAVRGVPVVGDKLSWVDDALGADANVAFLYTANVDPHALWQTEFWNRSIGPVINIGTREPGPLAETSTTVDFRTGELLPVPGQPAAAGTSSVTHVLVPRTHPLQGTLAAERGPWTIYSVDPPVRLAAATDGIAADGWMAADAAYTNYAERDGTGTVGVRLSRFAWLGPDVPGRIRIRIGELAVDSSGVPSIGRLTATKLGTIHAGGEETFLLDAPPGPFRVEIYIEPTFSPADFGFPEDRELGAVVSFRFFPH